MLNLILKLILGGVTLIDMYVALILAGRRTFDQVPAKYQSGVHEDLLALGLDDNGNPLP